MEIKYPVRYDKFNQIIVDSTPRTICLMSWQGLRMEKTNIDKFGNEVAKAMNDSQAIKNAVDAPKFEDVPATEIKRRGNPNWIKKPSLNGNGG